MKTIDTEPQKRPKENRAYVLTYSFSMPILTFIAHRSAIQFQHRTNRGLLRNLNFTSFVPLRHIITIIIRYILNT